MKNKILLLIIFTCLFIFSSWSQDAGSGDSESLDDALTEVEPALSETDIPEEAAGEEPSAEDSAEGTFSGEETGPEADSGDTRESAGIVDQYFPVEGLNQWQYEYDISSLEEGTYNLIVRGVDIAGNMVESRAVDIYVDPDSDLPFVSFTYPSPNMRISGDLNVLGTAGDDDSLSIVEIKLNDGEYEQIYGSEYWSHVIPTEDLPDGKYVLTARSTDIKGLVSPEERVEFHIDRKIPVITTLSHSSGDLVSGTITIEGTVEDSNGLKELLYSLDGGKVFESVKLSGDYKEGAGEFSLKINTRDLEQGPGIIWFQATDSQGSSGRAALLLYIDNAPPVLNFLYPGEGEPVNGRFSVVGRVYDEVGIDSLSYTLGDDQFTDIPLEPGDPYWKIDVDYTGMKKTDILFVLKDLAGNTEKYPLKLQLDPEGDLPSAEVFSPVPGGSGDSGRFQGAVLDDDGPAGIIYSLDKDEEKYEETGRFFDVSLGDLTPGEHVLKYRAKDIYGVEGSESELEFLISPESPVVALNAFVFNDETESPYAKGTRTSPDRISGLKGSVSFDSGKGSASISVSGAEPSELKLKKNPDSGAYDFLFLLPEPMPFGFVEISITALDELGSETEFASSFWIENFSENLSEHGFHGPFGDYSVSGDKELVFRYTGYPVSEFNYPDTFPFLDVKQNGEYVTVRGLEAGTAEDFGFTALSDRGVEFSLGPVDITSDLLSPVFSGVTPDSGEYRGKISIKGTVNDDSGKPSVFWNIGEMEPQELVLKEAEEGYEFSFSPDSVLFTGTGNTVVITALDSAGRRTSIRRGYRIPDPAEEAAPVKLYILSPEKNGTIFPENQTGGKMSAAALVTGLPSVNAVYWSLDGGDEKKVNGFPAVSAEFPVPSPGSHTVSFRAEYGEGKQLSASGKFTIAPQPGLLSLVSSVTGETSGDFVQGGDIVVTGDTELEGVVTGTGKYVSSVWTMDNREPVSFKISAGEKDSIFRLPLESAGYGRHDIHIEIEDSFGRKQSGDYYFFALEDSSGRNIEDNEGFYLLDNPSEDMVFSIDPGDDIKFFFYGRELRSVELTEEQESFPVSFSGSMVELKASGVDVVDELVLKAVTIDGDEFTYGPFSVTSDTTPPELMVESLSTGDYLKDRIELSGYMEDDYRPAGIEYSLAGGAFKSLEETPVPDEDDNPEEDEVAEEESVEEAVTEEAVVMAGRYDFHGMVDMSSLDDGPVSLVVKAVDSSGNNILREFFVIKDTRGPELVQILPEGNESVNGKFSYIFRGTDEWSEGFDGSYFLEGQEMETYSGRDSFLISMDLSSYQEVPEDMYLTLTDTSGNTETIKPELFFQPESDIPEVQIQLPEEGVLVTSDFTVSGIILDDDSVKEVLYRVDDGEMVSLEGGNSFSLDIPIETLTDNGHRVEVKAVDLWGVESETVGIDFNVSLAVPVAQMTSPEIGKSVRNVVTLAGTASDANGISEVYVSLDNGNSYHLAEGAEDWTYEMDSRVLVDGNYMVQIKVLDNFGQFAVYSSLLTVDNTPPSVQLSSPMDGLAVTEDLPLQMRISDDIGVKELRYTIKPLENNGRDQDALPGEEIEDDGGDGAVYQSAGIEGDLTVNEVVIDSIGLTDLEAGRYNLSVFAYDDAGNETVVSRNILRKAVNRRGEPGFLFPFQGTDVCDAFVLEGKIDGDFIPEALTLKKNGIAMDVITPDSSGYFYRYIMPEEVQEGPLSFTAEVENPDGSVSISRELKLNYSVSGPWIRIDSIRTGEYLGGRPWVRGEAGYTLPVTGEELSKDEKKALELDALEYSLDNGKNFTPFKAKEEWKFRLETQMLHDGDLGILVRARFRNGESAVTQLHVVIDGTPPSVAIITPEDGLAFNESLSLNGIASDESGLSDVSVMIREGSKNSYEIPSFIQGLYVDGHFLGATFWEVGAGLTFFDDNVKIQGLFGISPQGRFDGNVFGLKLLANVATIPWGYFLGPDFSFLSSSFAVGSAFEYFSMPSDNEEQSGLVLGALVGQIELVKAKFESLKYFNTYSVYFEDQLWFISSDVEGGLENRIAFGIRIGVF